MPMPDAGNSAFADSSFWVRFAAERYVLLPTAKVSEEVNRKLRVRKLGTRRYDF